MTLYENLPYHVTVDGKRYRIRPYFDVVLDALDVLNQEWNPTVCMDYLCKRLVWGRPKNKAAVVTEALRVLSKPNRTRQQGPVVKTVDFAQDADMIYSAFLQSYGIDLIEQRGKLHWFKFLALFSSLPSNTKMADVIKIRSTPIPAPTKHNQSEIQNLIKLKNTYALQLSEKERQKQLDAGLQRLAGMLQTMAEKG